MPIIHDPYLDTVRRSLNDEKMKTRQKKIDDNPIATKGFFSQNIDLGEYLQVPQKFEKVVALFLFITIPYAVGLVAISLFMGYGGFLAFTTFDFHMYMLAWTVGYETIALILLFMIMKSAVGFNKYRPKKYI